MICRIHIEFQCFVERKKRCLCAVRLIFLGALNLRFISTRGEIMVSAASRPYIDASVPVLREHDVTITRTFYRNMFEEHPNKTNLFNMGNQASGARRRARAAAGGAGAAGGD